MDWVDVAIVLFALLSLSRGYRIGLVRQAGSTVGFIIGLFLGSWLGAAVISYESSDVAKSLTSLLLVLAGGFVCMTAGEVLSMRLKDKLARHHSLDAFDGGLGSLMSAATLLFAIWLGAAILVLGPASGLQQAIKNSRILSTLNTTLPPATSLLSSLNKLIDPNGFPQVFSGLEPNPNTTISVPSLGSFNAVVQAAQPSVVRVEGTGCGGIVEGSGFVYGGGLVATDAHVVAGVASPKVADANGVHNTRVVLFDPDVDLAVLAVDGLAGRPLAITSAEQPNGTQGVVLGYPGGGSFNAQPAVIMDRFMAYGRNIYGQGNTVRDVYSVRAHIIPGNSGGPLVGADGQVLGMVFATSTAYSDVGYALTGHQITSELATAHTSDRAVGTGSCSE